MASSWIGWIIFINDCRWLFHVGHHKSQWLTSSTSPELHSLQVLFSRFTPRHLPISTWRGAVPPRNLRIILLSLFILIPAHCDSSPHSMMMVCIVDNFGFLSSSSLHFSCTFLHATLSSIPLSSVSDRFWMCICPTFSQSKSGQHLTIFLIHEPLPWRTDSIATLLSNLLSYIGLVRILNQNVHCSCKWHTSTTFPLSHSLQTRSFLFNPCHLPISILNAAGIVVGFTMPIPPPHATPVEQVANVRCQCICTSFGCRIISVALCNISSVLELSINKVRIGFFLWGSRRTYMLSDVGRPTLAHLPHLDGKQSTQGMPPFLQEQLLHLPVLLYLK